MQWHTSLDNATTHSIFTFGGANTGGAFGLQLSNPDPEPPANPLRSNIVAAAESQLGVAGDSRECQPYGPCDDWCAMFARWVWSHGGVAGTLFSTNVARGVGLWGQQQGLFKARPAGTRGGNPLPGDIVVYGAPANATGGHVAIVARVNADGTLVTVNGNFNNRVQETTIDPNTATAGGDDLLVSGYVSPPGA
jgi:hypothetical protein